MNSEASQQLSDSRFKSLVDVQRTTFEEMLSVLKTAYQRKRAKGGRKPKLSLDDLLMVTIQYMRE
ncbi:transposase-like protein%2C IS1381 ISSpn7 [Streptococcus pneumoniae]|nr:transposase-like protein%2C IS1381 ISSpn7 [Streptococcus pneumoniae]